MSEHPPDEDSRNQRPVVRAAHVMLLFVTGAVVGTGVSGLVWPAVFREGVLISDLQVFVLVLVPVIKLALGIVMTVSHFWRGAGIGLIASIPVGFLIFFGACAQGLSFH